MNILFDLDGTLCDPREGILHGFRHAYDVLKLPYPGDAKATALIGVPLLQCFQRLGLEEESEEAARHFQAFFEGRGFAEAKLYPGVLDGLRKLHAKGRPLGIASGKPSFAVKFVCESLGILPYFHGIFGCAAAELAPDKSLIVAEALSTLGWKAEETWMVGDRAQDRDAARAQGLRFVGASWGFAAVDELKGEALAQDWQDLMTRITAP